MERGRVGARRITEFDTPELQPSLRRIGEAAGVGGRGDARFGVQQFGEPFGGADGAQQVAIDLGERAESARDEPAGEHEGGDGAAGDRPRRDPRGAVPEQGRDRAEEQADDDRGHDRAEANAALGGGEIILDRHGEALGFAAFLTEGLDDLHRAQLLGGCRADVGDAVLAGARHILQAAAEQHDRQDDDGDAEQDAAGETRREREEIDDAADAHHHVAQRDRDRGADHLLDHRRVRRHARGDFGGAVFLEEAGSEAEQIALYRLADVGDGAFAEPADEIEAQRRGEREGDHDQIEEAEMRGDVAAAGDEAAVDHFLELPGDGERRERRDAERDRGDQQLQRIAAGVAPDHAEAAELARAPVRRAGRFGDGSGGGCLV